MYILLHYSEERSISVQQQVQPPARYTGAADGPLLGSLQHREDLGLMVPNHNLAVIPIDNLHHVSNAPILRRAAQPINSATKTKLTMGLWKLPASLWKFLIASVTVPAPFTTCPMSAVGTYSSIVSTWSAVGGSSVTLRSKGSRVTVGPEAGASLAAWVALVEACLRRLTMRVEAGELALWKRVMMSRVLRCGGGRCELSGCATRGRAWYLRSRTFWANFWFGLGGLWSVKVELS